MENLRHYQMTLFKALFKLLNMLRQFCVYIAPTKSWKLVALRRLITIIKEIHLNLQTLNMSVSALTAGSKAYVSTQREDE